MGRALRAVQKAKNKAAEVAKNATKKGGLKKGGTKIKRQRNTDKLMEDAGDALEGFGIVTLASLLPVLAVELLSISLTFMYTHEDIMALVSLDANEACVVGKVSTHPTPTPAFDVEDVCAWAHSIYVARLHMP